MSRSPCLWEATSSIRDGDGPSLKKWKDDIPVKYLLYRHAGLAELPRRSASGSRNYSTGIGALRCLPKRRGFGLQAQHSCTAQQRSVSDRGGHPTGRCKDGRASACGGSPRVELLLGDLPASKEADLAAIHAHSRPTGTNGEADVGSRPHQH
jgi:hypothetical protein